MAFEEVADLVADDLHDNRCAALRRDFQQGKRNVIMARSAGARIFRDGCGDLLGRLGDRPVASRCEDFNEPVQPEKLSGGVGRFGETVRIDEDTRAGVEWDYRPVLAGLRETGNGPEALRGAPSGE